VGLLKWVRLTISPPRLEDQDFGLLRFMYISRAPERSYWEANWNFSPVGYSVSIGLPGDVRGPSPESRAFFLSRVPQFEHIIRVVRPRLDSVCREWLGRPLASDLWTDVKLAGFGVQDAASTPVSWEISFETTGQKWLGITIPFVGESAQEAVVDT